MKEKSLNLIIHLWLHNWTMHRNLAKFNSYHWLIPQLPFSLSLCVSLSELLPSSLVHDHLQSCCSCCCQIWACRQPPQAHQSFIIDTQAYMQYKRAHTHTHKQTTTTCTQEHKISRVQYTLDAQTHRQQWVSPICGYWPITHCMEHPANVAAFHLTRAPQIYYIFCCLLTTIFVPP